MGHEVLVPQKSQEDHRLWAHTDIDFLLQEAPPFLSRVYLLLLSSTSSSGSTSIPAGHCINRHTATMPSPPRPKRRPDYVFGINLNPDPLPPGVSYPKHLCYLACQPTRQKTRGDRVDEDKGEGGTTAPEAKTREEAARKPTSGTEQAKKESVRGKQRKIGFLASLLPLGVGRVARELDRRDRRVKEWVEGPGSGEYGSESGFSGGLAAGEDKGEETEDDGGEDGGKE